MPIDETSSSAPDSQGNAVTSVQAGRIGVADLAKEEMSVLYRPTSKVQVLGAHEIDDELLAMIESAKWGEASD